MDIGEFKLERYFARYEFKARYLLSSSDCEALTLQELLAMADPADLALWENLRLGYTESTGHPRLREKVSGLYRNVPPGLVLTVVPEEGILVCLQALLSRGDHAIVTWPAYQSLYAIPEALGCAVTKWPLTLLNGAWELDPDFLERNITGRTRLLILNFPHNPTGYLPPREAYYRIIETARDHGLFVLSDEMYRFLELAPSARLEPAADLYEKAISLGGLSKAFGLPGLRTGWLAARDLGLIARFSAWKDYTTICGAAPSEILAIMALEAKDRLLARSREIIARNLAAAEAFFLRHPGLFSWIPPQGGSTAFPGLHREISVEAFCRGAVEKKDVMILPGTVFDFEGNHFRVGLGRADLPEVLDVLEGYVKGL
jgi:aspartate/methionine/tyrosine aminotransferase